MVGVMLFGFCEACAWICMDTPNIVRFAMWCRMIALTSLNLYRNEIGDVGKQTTRKAWEGRGSGLAL